MSFAMKTTITLGAVLMAAFLSLPAQAVPADDLAVQLDRACAALPAAPNGEGMSLAEHSQAVKDFAATVGNYQDCLYGELNRNRAALTQSEQEVIAARLSRSSYTLSAARVQYATAVRATRMPTQVAEGVL
jgi:hypothetical protein